MKPSLDLVAIEVTKLCDMKCVMCVSHGEGVYQGQADDQPPFIDIELFRSIVEQYVELQPAGRSVAPQFQGEPLLNPRFLEYCEILERSETPFGFTTNGTKLTEERAKELVKFKYFRNICFSIDGASKGVYERIRKLGRYDKVMRNINRFLDIAQQAKTWRSDPLGTQVSFTEQPLNAHESEAMIKQWVDKVDFISTNNVAVNGRPTKFYFQPKVRVPCGDLWSYMVVLTDGKVVPCCRDYLYQLEMGNLRETSLKDIWLGKKYEHFRSLHLKKRWDEIPVCNDCDTWMCRVEERQKSVIDRSIVVETGPFFRTVRRGSDLFDSIVVLANAGWQLSNADSCASVVLGLSRALPVHVLVPDLDDDGRIEPLLTPVKNVSVVRVGKTHTPMQRQALSLYLNRSKLISPLLWVLNPDYADFVAGCYSPYRVVHVTRESAFTRGRSNGDKTLESDVFERLLARADLLVCDASGDLAAMAAAYNYRGEAVSLDNPAASEVLAAVAPQAPHPQTIWLQPVATASAVLSTERLA